MGWIRRLSLILRAALLVAIATGVAGCRENGNVTALRIVTSWSEVEVDQLEFTVKNMAGKTVVPAQRRPARPKGPLMSGADVVIYFGDELGGSDVACEVRGLAGGREVGASQARPHLIARNMVITKVRLAAGPGSKTDGATCVSGMDCQSGVCTDGVCCHTECVGICRACNVPGRAGTCSMVPEGIKHGACADQGAGTCGYDGTCDGRGTCRRYPSGTRCVSGACDGSSITAAGACDGEGHCSSGPVVTCAPFTCNPVDGMPRCFDRCTTAAECVSGRECLAGSCGKKIIGAACSDAAECTSGFCVDGTCCDSKCDGPCLSCAQVGAMGTCRAVPDGMKDPRGVCVDGGVGKCGFTGTCNGAGGCARYAAGTICLPATCQSTTLLITAGRCDGVGGCSSGGPLACAPFACSNGACNSTCASNADCAPDRICDASKSCGKKGLGQPCSAGTECGSGFCVDGVCCNESCQGPCRSCTLGKTPGTCSNTPTGALDPRGTCKDLGRASCSTDGTCNGAGACRKYPTGTVCGSGSCNTSNNVRTLAPTCDSGGRCVTGATVSCGAYKCNGTSCFSACNSDFECVSPNVCIGGACGQRGTGAPCSRPAECMSPLTCIGSTCQLKPLGFACGGDAECGSGQCTEGVCCNSNACGACESCKVSGFVGFCHPVAAGSADARCTTDPASSCRQDGTCDGAGACRLYPAGTVCANASCNGQLRIKPKTCDGMGTCQDNGITDCDPYVCDPSSGTCFTSCNDREQCCCKNCINNSCL
jgi:hypothetical protein